MSTDTVEQLGRILVGLVDIQTDGLGFYRAVERLQGHLQGVAGVVGDDVLAAGEALVASIVEADHAAYRMGRAVTAA